MKKRRKIVPIPLQNYIDLLALLNETVGGAAGSSKKEYLLSRIYRKWKDALPDLENAPLFKVIGKKKRFDELMDKVYIFSEREKDDWANLFEFKGSHQHVKLRFSIDRLGLTLDDVIIIYGEHPVQENVKAWERFISHLKTSLEKKSIFEHSDIEPKNSGLFFLRLKLWSRAMPKYLKRMMLWALLTLVAAVAILAIWKANLFVPKVEVASIEKMAFPLPEKPSVAVLPFRNLSGDPIQNNFIDGLTVEITIGLSKVPSLFVIESFAHLHNYWFGPNSTRAQSLIKAIETVRKCEDLDNGLALCGMVKGELHTTQFDDFNALIEGKRAVERWPNSADAATFLAMILQASGRYEEALRQIDRALRINPFRVELTWSILAQTYLIMGKYEEAIATTNGVGIGIWFRGSYVRSSLSC
jgi:tetratricopeptide (TPR) repeat protein